MNIVQKAKFQVATYYKEPFGGIKFKCFYIVHQINTQYECTAEV